AFAGWRESTVTHGGMGGDPATERPRNDNFWLGEIANLLRRLRTRRHSGQRWKRRRTRIRGRKDGVDE
ncbi:hypothetical protein HN51_029473, partial [Arachis hypogaea]